MLHFSSYELLSLYMGTLESKKRQLSVFCNSPLGKRGDKNEGCEVRTRADTVQQILSLPP